MAARPHTPSPAGLVVMVALRLLLLGSCVVAGWFGWGVMMYFGAGLFVAGLCGVVDEAVRGR